MSVSYIQTLIARFFVLIIAFSVHEFAHAWTANYLGDDTPRLNGRLTLNPLAHLDVLGTLLLLVAGFGWAKPVPINPYTLRRRTPAGVMWVSLAGPVSNLLMAVVAALPLRFNLVPISFSSSGLLPTPGLFLYDFMYINLTLFLFNLIPIAPLDGEKVATYFLPPSWASFFDTIRPYSALILLVVVFGGQFLGVNILGTIMGPPLNALSNLLLG